jgi:hypothetical protein
MALTRLRSLACFLSALLAIPLPSAAFDTPLSDTAIREAYFLGQRHDETMARLLDKYTTRLPQPKTGPYIEAVTFFTPFAQLVLNSDQHSTGYSAQQAEIDHRDQAESVRVVIDIFFTDSYGPFIPRPTGSKSGSPTGLVPRPLDFWKDFQVQFFDNDKPLRPFTSSGQPKLSCSVDGGCMVAGATLQFKFLAESFPTNYTTVQIDPPEGEQVVVDVDLSSLR